MQILADYHTHTKYSHGKGTIEENVLEAISKGIKTIGISDHGYKHLAYGIDINDKIIENCDYIMAGYHFASTPTSLKSMFNHCNNYMIKNEKSKDYNTKAIINAMKNNDIFIITHPGDKGDVYIEEIAKVAKNTDTRLEINSSHGFLNSSQLVKIKGIGNKFIIGSDAHIPQNVGNFDLAMKIVKEASVDLSLIENIKI